MAQTRARAQGATLVTRADVLGVSSSNKGAPPDLSAPDAHAHFPLSLGNRRVPRVWRARPRKSSLEAATLRPELGQLDTRNHLRALGVAPDCQLRPVWRVAAHGRRRRSQGAGRHVGRGRAATGSGRDWLPGDWPTASGN